MHRTWLNKVISYVFLICAPWVIFASEEKSRVIVVADNIFQYLKDTTKPVENEKNIHVLIRAGTTDLALKMLTEGQADIAAITRSLSQEEKADHPQWVETPIASDALVFIVHPDNPLKSLSYSQVQEIYTNPNMTWGDLIGPDHELSHQKIQPMSKTPENGVFHNFVEYFRISDYQLKGNSVSFKINSNQENTARVATVSSDQAAVAQLAVRKQGIIFVSLTALKSYKNGKDFNVVAFTNVEPSVKTTFDRSYPITYRLNMVLDSKKSNSEASEYLAWILEGEGQDIFREFGFAPINLKTKIIQTTSSITRFRQF
ncbi:MAG: hypothetical protein FJ161_03630 [Gammaproteobacteria bacterium]|nr:hypothetical protein [Gammaproteobacteria bacterium]